MSRHNHSLRWAHHSKFSYLCIFVLLLLGPNSSAVSQVPATTKPVEPPKAKPQETKPTPDTPVENAGPGKELAGLKRLMPKYDVWIDPQRKLVVVEGRVVLRQGALEMFACPKGTKEHESIVSLNCKAWHVHAALMAVGAKPVHPVKFDPEYVPAKGTEIEIEALWRDADGKNRRMNAQHWVQDNKGNVLKYPWVFGGSRFYKDEMTGQEIYLAEDGDLICVSNFTTATLDLPIESSADAGSLLFLANTKNIPKQNTVVRLVLRPVLEDKEKGDKPDEKETDKTKTNGKDDAAKKDKPDESPAKSDSPKKNSTKETINP